eukprot:COSAG05_NODE_3991_length_1734_cov_1.630581_1_plen_116_part_00
MSTALGGFAYFTTIDGETHGRCQQQFCHHDVQEKICGLFVKRGNISYYEYGLLLASTAKPMAMLPEALNGPFKAISRASCTCCELNGAIHSGRAGCQYYSVASSSTTTTTLLLLL